MSKLRSLSTAFWSDPFIEELTPNEKLLFIYLITNDKTNMLGIYESSIKKIAFETGINKETVEKALKDFEKVGKVKYLNNYVILVNYLKHQNFNTNMKKSAIDVYNGLPKELKDSNISIDKSNPLKGFETLSNHLGMVRKVEVEVEDEIEVEEEIKYEVEEKKEVFNFRKELIALGVKDNIAIDFLKVRKTKRATNTETAFKLIKNQIEISNMSANECIIMAVENSWQTFKNEWAHKKQIIQPAVMRETDF